VDAVADDGVGEEVVKEGRRRCFAVDLRCHFGGGGFFGMWHVDGLFDMFLIVCS